MKNNYKLKENESKELRRKSGISDFDKEYLPDVDLRLLISADHIKEVRKLIATLRLRKSVNNLNNSTTRLMWAQISIAIVALIVAICIARN